MLVTFQGDYFKCFLEILPHETSTSQNQAWAVSSISANRRKIAWQFWCIFCRIHFLCILFLVRIEQLQEREKTLERREKRILWICEGKKGKSSQSKVQESLHFCPFSGFQEQHISISSLLFIRQPFIASTSISIYAPLFRRPNICGSRGNTHMAWDFKTKFNTSR